MTRAKVFIVDDHALIIQGLTAIVQQATTLTLVGTASTAEQFLAFLERSDVVPDVCVVDVEMPGMGGISMIPAVKEKYPEMKIIVLTMHDQPFYRNRAIKSGADAFLLKSFSTDEFVSTIQQVLSGKKILSEPVSDPRKNNITDLTAREKVILRMIAQGKSNREIALELFISVRTVDVHRTNIMRKLNASSRIQLVHYAYANNLA